MLGYKFLFFPKTLDVPHLNCNVTLIKTVRQQSFTTIDRKQQNNNPRKGLLC